EWWTYRPSDFLLFSARTYYRLFELYNADVWPAQLLTSGLGLLLWVALRQGRRAARRAAFALLAMAWLWVAWGFHWQRFAGINWAATWYAAAFGVEAVLLLACALRGPQPDQPALRDGAGKFGMALLLTALLVQPLLGALLGRSWLQAEVFGLAPDPSVLATLGVLLLQTPRRCARRPALAWLLWPIPLLWCALTGMTLATMHADDAWLMPIAALLSLAALWWRARTGRGPTA
ncbi:MAG: DUF6064 family protein, partial [Pseudomonadota bacterium]